MNKSDKQRGKYEGKIVQQPGNHTFGFRNVYPCTIYLHSVHPFPDMKFPSVIGMHHHLRIIWHCGQYAHRHSLLLQTYRKLVQPVLRSSHLGRKILGQNNQFHIRQQKSFPLNPTKVILFFDSDKMNSEDNFFFSESIFSESNSIKPKSNSVFSMRNGENVNINIVAMTFARCQLKK